MNIVPISSIPFGGMMKWTCLVGKFKIRHKKLMPDIQLALLERMQK